MPMLPKLSKLPFMAAELAAGTAIVLVHLVIASTLDRPRPLALAGRSGSQPPSE
jgi:hypothetical protein